VRRTGYAADEGAAGAGPGARHNLILRVTVGRTKTNSEDRSFISLYQGPIQNVCMAGSYTNRRKIAGGRQKIAMPTARELWSGRASVDHIVCKFTPPSPHTRTQTHTHITNPMNGVRGRMHSPMSSPNQNNSNDKKVTRVC
jgi:hypothetical protein